MNAQRFALRTGAALALAACTLSAQAGQKVCVFDIVGATGDAYNMAKDYALAMQKEGASLELKAYNNEATATSHVCIQRPLGHRRPVGGPVAEIADHHVVLCKCRLKARIFSLRGMGDDIDGEQPRVFEILLHHLRRLGPVLVVVLAINNQGLHGGSSDAVRRHGKSSDQQNTRQWTKQAAKHGRRSVSSSEGGASFGESSWQRRPPGPAKQEFTVLRRVLHGAAIFQAGFGDSDPAGHRAGLVLRAGRSRRHP